MPVRSLRRLAAVVCSSFVAVSVPVLAPGAARAEDGSVRRAAATSSSITDPRGDVKDDNDAVVSQPEADIVAAGAVDRGGDVVFTVLVDRPTDPTATKNWAGGASLAVWAVDTSGDSQPDYGVAFDRNAAGQLEVQVVTAAGNAACTGTASIGPNREYTATVPASCLGNPASFRYGAAMQWDTDPANDTAPVVGDSAPDGDALAGPVEAPAGAPGGTPTDAPDPNLTRASGGYWLAGDDGGVFSFNADFYGSTGSIRLNKPIVGLTADRSGPGYWFVASDGGIFSFGHARFFGSAGNLRLNQPIVGMAATPSGNGYWLVASDGGIFSFGDAGFFGSAGDIRLSKPIVAIAPTPTGKGYWLVASDGGVFSYGDAKFYGSAGNLRLNQPIVAAAATPSGNGYWFVARDGGVFAFGDAGFFGSGAGPGAPVVGFAPARDGAGYSIARADGSVVHCGSAPKAGSLAGHSLNRPIVAIAATA